MKLSRMIEIARKRFSAPATDPSASGQERRRSNRARLDFPVELQDAARRPAYGAVHLTDMSGVGVGITSSKDFRVGERLAVRVRHDGRELAASARVRWARPEGVLTSYGLEFEGVTGWDRFRLELAARPGLMTPGEAGEMLLQFAAAAVTVAVGLDWCSSDPSRMTALLFSLPWLASTALGAGLVWAAARL